MKIRCIIGWAAFAAILASSEAWAWDQDFAAQYFERKDTIVSGAGDARDVNAATHIIDPWPPYVGDRQIPANGERMTGAVDRYRTNRPWRTPCAISPAFDLQFSNIYTQTVRGCALSDQSVGAAAGGAVPGGAVPGGAGFGIAPR
jgi:hypothetical protein